MRFAVVICAIAAIWSASFLTDPKPNHDTRHDFAMNIKARAG